MEKRILLAFLLSLAVLYGFRTLYSPPPTAPPAPVSAPAEAPAPGLAPSQAGTAEPAPAPAPAPAAKTVADVGATSTEELRIDTTLYSATLTNRGAVLKGFTLKVYTDNVGKPIELIDSAGAEKIGFPLAIATADPKLNEILSAADYAVQRNGMDVVMEFASGGVHARKTFIFDSENYELSVATILTQDGKDVPHQIVWQGGFGDQSIVPAPAYHQVDYPSEGGYTKEILGSLSETKEIPADRVGVEDQYFLAMLMRDGPDAPVTIRKQEYTGKDGTAVATSYLAMPAEGEPLRIYVGPKDRTWLQKADPRLAAVIDYDYGFFEFIVKPLTVALMWVHSYIRNFGWAIIVLTLFISLVLFPLRLKQQLSMQKMQSIQPQMRTLQDQYKKLKANDPKRAEIQSRMMGLYKEHGINPMSGCLPLLLQMPFLIAFWKMLSVAIELRQAPWILWIKDLSQPDPYFIMPILMALSMLITQKMTPSTGDPAQQRVMMIMPVLFTVMFLWAQAGLMLYWITSNLVGIGQQMFINKYWAPTTDKPVKHRSPKKVQRTE